MHNASFFGVLICFFCNLRFYDFLAIRCIYKLQTSETALILLCNIRLEEEKTRESPLF